MANPSLLAPGIKSTDEGGPLGSPRNREVWKLKRSSKMKYKIVRMYKDDRPSKIKIDFTEIEY